MELSTLVSDWEAFASTPAAAGDDWRAVDDAFRQFVAARVHDDAPELPLEEEDGER